MGSAKAITLALALFLCTLVSTPAHAQGCTQCLDNTAATPPKTQAAYRHAIILLTLTAGGLFVTTLALFKRHR
jgi:hypothetical protein